MDLFNKDRSDTSHTLLGLQGYSAVKRCHTEVVDLLKKAGAKE